MPLPIPKVTPAPDLQTISVNKWMNGTVTAFDDARSPVEGLRSSGNVILDQDGVIRPRPSLTTYGPQPTGTVLGQIYEFRKFTGLTAENWLVCIQVLEGDAFGTLTIARGEDSVWTECTGKTYDSTASAHFLQLDDKVLIMNGVDNLSYLAVTGTAITAFTALDDPSGSLTGTVSAGITGTAYNIYYAISANSNVGETAKSTVLTKDIGSERAQWDSDVDSVIVQWPAVTGADSYNLYMGQAADGSGEPTLYLIAGGLDAGTTQFTDNGSRAQDLTRIAPGFNSTAGPKITRADVINGRVWGTGDAENRNYVWRGGDFGFELDFSPSNGGGYTPVGQGGKDIPVRAIPYRSGQGEPRVTILTQGTNGSGKRYTLAPQTVTYGSTTFVVWQLIEDSGQDGTDSPDAVILYNNDIHYPSRDGFKTTGTLPQLQNVLSTRRTSNTIEKDISSLNTSAMDKAVGLAYEGRLYFALPVLSSTNNQIWVLDLDRQGAWMKPWDISAEWMLLYNDNDGVTHFLVLEDNNLYELSYRSLTADNGTAFSTRGNSGQIRFSKDGRIWGRLIKLTFVVLRPQGSISFTVSGKTEDDPIALVGSETFSAQSSRAGWSEPGSGWSRSSRGYLRGWSEINVVPRSFNDATQEVDVEVDEDLQWYSYGWTTTGAGTDYSLADVVATYVPVGFKDL